MDTRSLVIMNILIIVSVGVPLLISIFSGSKKETQEQSGDKPVIKPKVSMPHITVVFQKDVTDNDEIMREVADMYISNRVYYYAGKTPDNGTGDILPEKYIKYDDIDFSSYMRVEV